MQTANRLEGIGEYYFSQKLREIDALNREGKNIINLGIGSPDLPPHPDVMATLAAAAAQPDTHAYQSYKGVPALREAIAQWYGNWYGVQLDAGTEILPLIGSKEGIMHVCMTWLNPGDAALVPNPGYPTYRAAVRLSGGDAVEYSLKEQYNFEPDFVHLERLVKENNRIKLMFVNCPHMPTGKTGSMELFEKLVHFARRHGILIVHDNPYSFILNHAPASMLAAAGAKDVVVELNSLSKSHNMAGWRVGMLCGREDYIQAVLRFKSNMDSGMFLPLQLAAAKALQLPADWYRQVNEIYTRRRQLVFNMLNGLGCTYSGGQAGLFVWAAVPGRFANGYAMSDYLLAQAGLFITPGAIFGSAGDAYIRVSLCSTEARLQEAAERILNIKMDV